MTTAKSSLGALSAAAALAATLTMPSQALASSATQSQWAGPYVGGFLGAARHEAEWNELGDDWWNGAKTVKTDDVYGGGFAGYNWQSNSYVYGVEADIAVANNESEDNLSSGSYDDVSVNALNWLTSLRARAGVARNDFLFFVSGGVAVAGVDTEMRSDDYPDETYRPKNTLTGWVAGGGVEYRLTKQAAVRVEALYHDFGDETYNQPDDAGDRNRISNTVLTGRIGVSYFFD